MVMKFRDVINCTVKGFKTGHLFPPNAKVMPKLVAVK